MRQQPTPITFDISAEYMRAGEERLRAVIALQVMRTQRERSAGTATHLPTPGKNAAILKKIGCDLPDDKAHYCCGLLFECMDEPVIDPTILNIAIDPNTGKSFINPAMPEHYKNFHDAPRYDRRSLLGMLDAGKIKSPTTRMVFEPSALIPDKKLQAEIAAFIKCEDEKYERRFMHRVLGNLYFKIKPSDSGVATYKMIVILHGQEIQKNTSMFIDEKFYQFILGNCGLVNLPRLEKFFSESGHSAELINEVIQNYKKSITYPVIGNLSCMIEPLTDDNGRKEFRLSIYQNGQFKYSLCGCDSEIERCILPALENKDIETLKNVLKACGEWGKMFLGWIALAENNLSQSSRNSASPAGMFDTSRTQATQAAQAGRVGHRITGPSIAPLD